MTMRDETEWVELVDNGFNRLVGSNSSDDRRYVCSVGGCS